MLLFGKKNPNRPLLQHCLSLNPVKCCVELFVSIPKEFPLKPPQLSCKVFISGLWKAGFSEGHQNIRSHRAPQYTHIWEAPPGEHGAAAHESQAWLGKKPQTPQLPQRTCVFLFKSNPLLAISEAKAKKTYKVSKLFHFFLKAQTLNYLANNCFQV